MLGIDFETYSEAGYYFYNGRWHSVSLSSPHGLGAVGAAVYSEHESTEVLSLTYDNTLWLPGMRPPVALFEYIKSGGRLRAWNAMFEYWIWLNVCHRRMGWPPLPLKQLVDTMGMCQSYGGPGKLSIAGPALGVDIVKDTDGSRLIQRYCKPKQPSKKNSNKRHLLSDNPKDFASMCRYNLNDVRSETALFNAIPLLSRNEQSIWLMNAQINARGVKIDTAGLAALECFIIEAKKDLNAELYDLTSGAVPTGDSLPKLKKWLVSRGMKIGSLKKETITDHLSDPLTPPDCRRALEIRQLLGSTSVTKTAAIRRRLCADGRIRDLFVYAGAERTSRFAGRGPQPQNLPSSGPPVNLCDDCGGYSNGDSCFFCGSVNIKPVQWSVDVAEFVLNLSSIRGAFDNPMKVISGCLRALFCAEPGKVLVCSDFSAIEAVVLAILAREYWRIDVFKTHGKIYETSASKITGVPLSVLLEHKDKTGADHPYRKKIGKVAELACFSRETLVLTDRGYVHIDRLKPHHLVFDGETFVAHRGVVNRGIKRTIGVMGVAVTPDHKFWVEKRHWETASDLHEFEESRREVLRAARERLEAAGLPSYYRSTLPPPKTGLRTVYDVLNAGPKRRFTILTNRGPAIVHNSGYRGWIGAWKAFGADKHFKSDDEIKQAILAWRESSPAIVEFWGGQVRKIPGVWSFNREYFGIEGAAVQAILSPGSVHTYHGISFQMEGDTLRCRVPSGEYITYHNPRLETVVDRYSGLEIFQITYMGYNNDSKQGPIGWILMRTHGGKLTENIVQKVARDLLVFSMQELNREGFPIVLHVHDEIVSEVNDNGTDYVSRFERIMSRVPPWAAGWPVRAAGGWQGRRYRKD